MENSLADSKIKDTFVAFNAKGHFLLVLMHGCFLMSTARIFSEHTSCSHSHVVYVSKLICSVLWREREADSFPFIYTQISYYMPKNNEMRVDANNSTVNSTSGHDTATRHPILSITRYDADDLMQTTLRLGGEEALERLGLLVRHPHEDFAAEQAMRSLLNYYANVRYLCARLRGVILHAEASGAGKIRRKDVRQNHT